jgi:hypothetical protein
VPVRDQLVRLLICRGRIFTIDFRPRYGFLARMAQSLEFSDVHRITYFEILQIHIYRENVGKKSEF